MLLGLKNYSHFIPIDPWPEERRANVRVRSTGYFHTLKRFLLFFCPKSNNEVETDSV